MPNLDCAHRQVRPKAVGSIFHLQPPNRQRAIESRPLSRFGVYAYLRVMSTR